MQWHRQSPLARTLGFLLFHWNVIENFRRAGGPRIWAGGLRPFSGSDFTNFGWPYTVAERATPGNVDSLADFSRAIEGWHGDAHMAIGMATGTEQQMMDPGQNIFLLNFWRLHYFINDRFLEQLDNYYGQGAALQQVQRLQRRHHRDVSRI